MLSKCKLLNCDVEIDKEKTEQWYAQADDWGCDCGNCINFLEVVKRDLLPSHIKKHLESLHIPASKATYVCLLDGEHLYQFSYRIVGRILSGESVESAALDWGEVRCCHEPYPYGAPGFPTPHFDLEFWITLPWILDERE